MQAEIVERLIAINRTFYQQFAGPFDATRKRPQPGVLRLIDRLLEGQRILDLGCGNGSLWRTLAEGGFAGEYTGLDFSPELVQAAAGAAGPEPRAVFLQRDLSLEWDAGLPGPFDRIAAFAVFHHLPPAHLKPVLARCRALLSPGGSLLLSCWQFLNSPRWRERIQPWEKAGLRSQEVGPDDYLLDWRCGGAGLRYVHHYSEMELGGLAAQAGFGVQASFASDGAEGNLGLYQVWNRDK